MTPFLRYEQAASRPFIFGGFFPSGAAPNSPSPGIPDEISSSTNLVYYDWEMAGDRVECWLYISQFCRFVMGLPQLPSDTAGVPWLQKLMHIQGNTLTLVRSETPTRISFDRRAAFGLTAIELLVFTDWLESPQFPIGFLSLPDTR
jgi:hypothetical protein